MQITFSAQFHNFRKTTLGDNLITLSVDRIFSKEIAALVGKETGTQFLVILDEENAEVTEDTNNAPAKERFFKKMHAMLNQLAEIRKTSPEEEKEKLKKRLIAAGVIKESTTELTIIQLAKVCNMIQEEMQ